MLKIVIPAVEYWDETMNEFIYTKEQTLQLEHSLVSLSKWESKWNKPFLDNTREMTHEETIDYIRCMTITQHVPDDVYSRLTVGNIKQINQYIEAPMTATTVNDRKKQKNKSQIVTSEVIYSWMVDLNIPFECQKWHLNRLIMLIRVLNANHDTPEPMNKKDIMSRNRALNAARKNKLKTRG